MLIPARREHSASARQVPDSSCSLWQAVFWKRNRFMMAATEGARMPWARALPAEPANASANNRRPSLDIVCAERTGAVGANLLAVWMGANAAELACCAQRSPWATTRRSALAATSRALARYVAAAVCCGADLCAAWNERSQRRSTFFRSRCPRRLVKAPLT